MIFAIKHHVFSATSAAFKLVLNCKIFKLSVNVDTVSILCCCKFLWLHFLPKIIKIGSWTTKLLQKLKGFSF